MEITEVKNENSPNTFEVQNGKDIFNAFKQKFSTTVRRINVNSLGKEVGFREITVNEQKTLSKTSIENERRKDIIYDAQC